MGGGWNKAENYACSFQGSFDGNGHVVSGMTIVINEETPFMTEGGNTMIGYYLHSDIPFHICPEMMS